MRTNLTKINDLPDKVRAIMNNQILAGLRNVREAALKYAQSSHGFKNRTFNLEDSYGAGIYLNGRLIEKTLSSPKATKPIVRNGVSYDGHAAADNFLNTYQSGDGYTLVVVAGMFYATWVENIHGLDVLTGSYETALEQMKLVWKEIRTYYNEPKP